MRSSNTTAPLNRRSVLKHTTTASVFGLVHLTTDVNKGHASGDPAPSPVLRYDNPQTSRWRLGIEINTPTKLRAAVATFPVPIDWPEQTVKVLGRDVDDRVASIAPQDLGEGARRMSIGIPELPANAEATITLDFEIVKQDIVGPDKGLADQLQVPKRLDRTLKQYMGNSPMIDASHVRIRMLSREINAMDHENAWARVRKIYEVVRERVKYREGEITKASTALIDGKGDCEDMTSLFVALCRNSRIPARMVWIPGHCYPEFYLEMPVAGQRLPQGVWLPCQAAGSDQFGSMQEKRFVLQKGDRFSIPGQRQPVRYVTETFRCDLVGSKGPRIRTIREELRDTSSS
ncbi:MAG: transglutaminase-like domain-containing protein [Planctomycetota bacterium]